MLLQVENVECMDDDHIKFDFLGKDSIRYENEVVVHPKVYQLVAKFCKQDGNKKGELQLLALSILCFPCAILDVSAGC